MIKNSKKTLKLAFNALKLNGMRGLFNRIKKGGTLPLNRRKIHPVKNTFLVLSTCAVLWVGTNTIRAKIFNHQQPVIGNNFGNDNVIDDNGNDIEFDDKGQIIEDDTTAQELALMKTQVEKLIKKDAGRRCADNIDSIDKIISMSLLPYNSCESDNEFDKYILSILFEANGKTYSLEYLTGKGFESTATINKEILGDFLSYLDIQNGECTLDACYKMSEIGAQISSLLGATYVGDAYVGYVESGEEYYIPVNKNGEISVYHAMCNLIDGPDLDPMQALLDQLSNNDDNALFEELKVPQQNEDLEKVLSFLQTESSENASVSAKTPALQTQRFRQAQNMAQNNYKNQARHLPKFVSRPELEH